MSKEAPPAARIVVDDAREAAAQWLRKMLAARPNLTAPDLAKRARIAPASVYRILNKTHSASFDTIARLAQALGEAPPAALLTGRSEVGFSEDAAPYEHEPPPDLRPETPNQSVWRIGSRALELAGIMPGDLVRLDQAAPARAGDAVVAQIYDFERGTATTRIRIYDGFSLVTRTMAPELEERALPVDGERVVIMGRIDRLLRRND